jgi:hypothetical protein
MPHTIKTVFLHLVKRLLPTPVLLARDTMVVKVCMPYTALQTAHNCTVLHLQQERVRRHRHIPHPFCICLDGSALNHHHLERVTPAALTLLHCHCCIRRAANASGVLYRGGAGAGGIGTGLWRASPVMMLCDTEWLLLNRFCDLICAR